MLEEDELVDADEEDDELLEETKDDVDKGVDDTEVDEVELTKTSLDDVLL